jgi:hypothetical protein
MSAKTKQLPAWLIDLQHRVVCALSDAKQTCRASTVALRQTEDLKAASGALLTERHSVLDETSQRIRLCLDSSHNRHQEPRP